MQHQPTPMLKWKILPDCSKFLSQNVQTYGYVFHDLHGPNPGQSLKIQWFLLNEICTDTHLRDYCGKDSSRKFFLEHGWGKTSKLGMLIRDPRKRTILICVCGRYQTGWKEAEYGSHVEDIDEKTWILTNQHHFLTMMHST